MDRKRKVLIFLTFLFTIFTLTQENVSADVGDHVRGSGISFFKVEDKGVTQADTYLGPGTLSKIFDHQNINSKKSMDSVSYIKNMLIQFGMENNI